MPKECEENISVGTNIFEKSINAFGDSRGVTTFLEAPYFGWGEGECGVNNEPVEIRWELDFR